MKIKVFPSGPLSTNAYVVSVATKEAMIIDPALGSEPYLSQYLREEGLKPIKILITHSHWDHIGDAAKLKKIYHIPIYIHPEDEPNLKEPGSDGLPLLTEIEAVQTDELLFEGQKIELGELSFRVIHTPGHSPGGVCFYEENENVLFSGDTLFKNSIGNVSFPTSNSEKMWESLKKLSLLPSNTRVYPGHGKSTTIGQEEWLSKAKEFFGF